jgi:hypothetical protein
LPVLGSGKTDYTKLEQLTSTEDRNGGGWISRLTEFVSERSDFEPPQGK